MPSSKKHTAFVGLISATFLSGTAFADQVINDDLIVDGSACIGFDCANGESFGFDTIRLKENNLRIKFDDTSSTGSFPSTDWQITINDSANGGQGKFAIEDISGGRTPVTIEANAPNHSLYVDDGGRLGIGTSIPVVDIHAVSGNTATLRLEQNGTSGFAPQTWDVAGNETNFFVRDVTNGSTLPLRIRPGAPSSAIFVDTDGDVGLGTASPDGLLEVNSTDDIETSSPHVLVRNDSGIAGNRRMIGLSNNGGAFIHMENRASSTVWAIVNANTGTDFLINDPDSPGTELSLSQAGDLSIEGEFISAGTTLNVPDYVFADDYSLMPLSDVRNYIETNKHLPKIPSAKTIAKSGLNHSQMQMALLEKVEELTLYTLQQQDEIAALQDQISMLKAD